MKVRHFSQECLDMLKEAPSTRILDLVQIGQGITETDLHKLFRPAPACIEQGFVKVAIIEPLGPWTMNQPARPLDAISFMRHEMIDGSFVWERRT